MMPDRDAPESSSPESQISSRRGENVAVRGSEPLRFDLIGVDLADASRYECLLCSAVVRNPRRHAEWHNGLHHYHLSINDALRGLDGARSEVGEGQ